MAVIRTAQPSKRPTNTQGVDGGIHTVAVVNPSKAFQFFEAEVSQWV